MISKEGNYVLEVTFELPWIADIAKSHGTPNCLYFVFFYNFLYAQNQNENCRGI
jgi:hypothetical protein